MSNKNYHRYGSAADIARLRDEYVYIGRHAMIADDGHLIVFAIPPRKEKKRDDRDKRGAKGTDDAEATPTPDAKARKNNGFVRGKFIEGTD